MKIRLTASGALLFVFILLFSCQPANSDVSDAGEADVRAEPEMSQEELIARGEHLVAVMDCNICHSPKIMTDRGPVPDTSRLLSGHPADLPLPAIDKSQIGPGKWVLFNDQFTASVGPWGVSFAANLTPDESGTGNWTFDNFKRAIREGKSKGLPNGRPLQPPMPWEAYAHSSDDDLRAIFAYLQSLKPVRNVVPSPIPPTEL